MVATQRTVWKPSKYYPRHRGSPLGRSTRSPRFVAPSLCSSRSPPIFSSLYPSYSIRWRQIVEHSGGTSLALLIDMAMHRLCFWWTSMEVKQRLVGNTRKIPEKSMQKMALLGGSLALSGSISVRTFRSRFFQPWSYN